VDPASTRAAIGAAEERPSRLFYDLRKRDERRVPVARLIVPEIADPLKTKPPEMFHPTLGWSAHAAKADLMSSPASARVPQPQYR
jgi:hypothetical protein